MSSCDVAGLRETSPVAAKAPVETTAARAELTIRNRHGLFVTNFIARFIDFPSSSFFAAFTLPHSECVGAVDSTIVVVDPLAHRIDFLSDQG